MGMGISVSQSSRRNHLEIMLDLLKIINEPQRLTHILSKSNMSYAQLVRYLDDLLEMELAQEQIQPFRSFIITSRGQKFLEMVKKKSRIMIPKAESTVRTENLPTSTKPSKL